MSYALYLLLGLLLATGRISVVVYTYITSKISAVVYTYLLFGVLLANRVVCLSIASA